MPNQDIAMKLIRLRSLLNIMDREIYEFSETLDSGTIPQRIDDFRALVASMKGIVQDISRQGSASESITTGTTGGKKQYRQAKETLEKISRGDRPGDHPGYPVYLAINRPWCIDRLSVIDLITKNQ